MSIKRLCRTLIIKAHNQNRMSYSQQELEALLQNEEFVSWILSSHPEENEHWQRWMQEHPDRPALVRHSREILTVIRESELQTVGTVDSHRLADQIWKDMQGQIHEERPVRRLQWLRYAAAIIIVLSVGLWYFQRTDNAIALEQTVSKDLVTARNNSTALQTIYLVDGSRITLNPQSTVRYSRALTNDERVVHLEGEAFFEVAKDAARPFYVYSGDIVTKVLGTSFRVVSDKLVAVKSGKVAVSRTERETDKYILLPNEQVIFNTGKKTLLKSGVTDMALLANPAPAQNVLHFDETPVSNVLDTLAKMYSIEISYDPATFSRCLVTVALDQASFHDQLDVLCRVIGASYDIQAFTVNIKGQGCN